MMATQETPELLTCECGGVLWSGCGVTHGQQLNETLLTCNECGHEETVLQNEVDKVTS